jgi:hypothetical protein
MSLKDRLVKDIESKLKLVPQPLAYALLILASGSLLGKLVTAVRARSLHLALRQQAARKRQARDEMRKQLAVMVAMKLKALDSNGVDQITDMTATSLLFAMRDGCTTSEAAVLALASRALEGVDRNLIAEEFYDEAVEQAMVIDRSRAAGTCTNRLLEGTHTHTHTQTHSLSHTHTYTHAIHTGVPISIKDQIHMKGADSTCGLAARTYQPSEEDGLLVELLRDAGAIPFVRTNVPQWFVPPLSLPICSLYNPTPLSLY